MAPLQDYTWLYFLYLKLGSYFINLYTLCNTFTAVFHTQLRVSTHANAIEQADKVVNHQTTTSMLTGKELAAN